MSFEKYTPREQQVLEESRAISDERLKNEGANEQEGGRLEATGEQVEQAKREMEADRISDYSTKDKPVVRALEIKITNLEKELSSVFAEMRTLSTEGKLPFEVDKTLAGINGKYYNSGIEGELRNLHDKQGYLENYKSTNPEKITPDLLRYEELVKDPKVEEYWKTKLEKEAISNPDR